MMVMMVMVMGTSDSRDGACGREGCRHRHRHLVHPVAIRADLVNDRAHIHACGTPRSVEVEQAWPPRGEYGSHRRHIQFHFFSSFRSFGALVITTDRHEAQISSYRALGGVLRFAFGRAFILAHVSEHCRSHLATRVPSLRSPVSGPQSPVPSLGSPVSFYGTGSRGDGRLQAEERADHRRRWVYWLARHHQSGQEIRGLQGGRLRQAGLLRDTQQSEVHPEQPELQIHQGRHPVSRLGDVRSGDGAD
jgi:hypothetical protein